MVGPALRRSDRRRTEQCARARAPPSRLYLCSRDSYARLSHGHTYCTVRTYVVGRAPSDPWSDLRCVRITRACLLVVFPTHAIYANSFDESGVCRPGFLLLLLCSIAVTQSAIGDLSTTAAGPPATPFLDICCSWFVGCLLRASRLLTIFNFEAALPCHIVDLAMGTATCCQGLPYLFPCWMGGVFGSAEQMLHSTCIFGVRMWPVSNNISLAACSQSWSHHHCQHDPGRQPQIRSPTSARLYARAAVSAAGQQLCAR
jgi:hypothetical protein